MQCRAGPETWVDKRVVALHAILRLSYCTGERRRGGRGGEGGGNPIGHEQSAYHLSTENCKYVEEERTNKLSTHTVLLANILTLTPSTNLNSSTDLVQILYAHNGCILAIH